MAYPECSRGDSPGWSSRDTWRTRNAPRVILPIEALGTRGVSGECPGYLPAGVTRNTWRWISNGGLGFDRGLRTGRIGRAIRAVGSGINGGDLIGGVRTGANSLG